MPQLAFNPGLTLTGFRTTRPCTLIIIINALVFSKLFYCSSVRSSTSQSNIAKLQAVQDFACRIISGSKKYDHVTCILRQLNWLPVKQHMYYRDSLMAFNAWMALLLGIYLIGSLNVHQYQHAKLEAHSCYIYHYLKPQLAKQHSTIVWSLFGTLYLKILSQVNRQLFLRLMRKRLLMGNSYFFSFYHI